MNVASLALMLLVTLQLARSTLVDPAAIAIGVISAILLIRFELRSTRLILGGAARGWAVNALR